MRRRIPNTAYDYILQLINSNIIFGVQVPTELHRKLWQSEIQTIPNYSPKCGFVVVNTNTKVPRVFGKIGAPVYFPHSFKIFHKVETNDKNSV